MASTNSFWNWLTGEWSALEHFLKSLVSSEVSAIAPLIDQALADIGINVIGMTTPSQIASVISQVAIAAAPKIEAAGLQVGVASVAAGIGNAIAKAKAAAAPIAATATSPTPAIPVVS